MSALARDWHQRHPFRRNATLLRCTCEWDGDTRIAIFDPDCPIIHLHKDAPMPTEANPKAARAIADGKAPLQYLEPAANEPTARVLEHGAAKYGYRNWRVNEINLRTYLGATQRHIDAMKNGEWLDPDSGEPHFAHIAANAHVVLDAQANDKLHDDTLEVESK